MSVFDRLFLTLAAVVTITACYPVEEKELIGQWTTMGDSIELEIFPDHTYSYFTPALQGEGYGWDGVNDKPLLVDIPAKQRNGTWRIGKSSYWQRQVKEGGFWEACCICITPDDEDEKDRGGCEPYSLQGDNLITPAFYIPQLGDVVVRAREWKKTK